MAKRPQDVEPISLHETVWLVKYPATSLRSDHGFFSTILDKV